jgi:hypothetical protein
MNEFPWSLNANLLLLNETGFVTVALGRELDAFSSFAGRDYAIKDYSGA